MGNKSSGPLVIGALIRVSSDRQEQRGASLDIQERQIRDAMRNVGGRLILRRGAESGTEGHERTLFEELLSDVIGRRVNAVMFADASRFNRNPIDNERFLRACMEAGCQFYLLERRFDLHNPTDRFFLSFQSVINRYTVEEKIDKSRFSRIKRARDGNPSSGGVKNIPYGLRFEIKNGKPHWSIDPKAQRKILRWYNAYMRGERGESWEKIAEREGENANTLRRRVRAAGSSEWIQEFKIRGNVEIVKISIPAILTEKQLRDLDKRTAENRLVRDRKFDYPLSGLLRCGPCGSILSGAGTMSPADREARYYRHHLKTRKTGCIIAVPARNIESMITGQIANLMSENKQIVESVRRTHAMAEGEGGKLKQESVELEELRREVQRKIGNLVGLVEAGGYTEMAAQERLNKLELQAAGIDAKLLDLKGQARSQQLPSDLDARVDRTVKALVGRAGRSPLFWRRDYKTELVRIFLGGPAHRDSNRGIWVFKESGGHFRYDAKGTLALLEGVTYDAPESVIDRAMRGKLLGAPNAAVLAMLAERAFNTHAEQRVRIRARS